MKLGVCVFCVNVAAPLIPSFYGKKNNVHVLILKVPSREQRKVKILPCWIRNVEDCFESMSMLMLEDEF